MAQDAQRRMPGLCDYYRSCSTYSLVERAFDIDVRRWSRRGLLVLGTTFLCHWLTEEDRTATLKVRVESDDQVRLIYRVRMPRKRWQQLERTVSNRLGLVQIRRSASVAYLSKLRSKYGGLVLRRR